MNGSNSISEPDRQQSWLYWELAKVCWNSTIMPTAHLHSMNDFYTNYNTDSNAISYYKDAMNLLQ